MTQIVCVLSNGIKQQNHSQTVVWQKKKGKKMGLQCNNNNSELYLHDHYNTSLQKRRKHDNYSDSVIKVQLQH